MPENRGDSFSDSRCKLHLGRLPGDWDQLASRMGIQRFIVSFVVDKLQMEAIALHDEKLRADVRKHCFFFGTLLQFFLCKINRHIRLHSLLLNIDIKELFISTVTKHFTWKPFLGSLANRGDYFFQKN